MSDVEIVITGWFALAILAAIAWSLWAPGALNTSRENKRTGKAPRGQRPKKRK